jgi:hypothetical protein
MIKRCERASGKQLARTWARNVSEVQKGSTTLKKLSGTPEARFTPIVTELNRVQKTK